MLRHLLSSLTLIVVLTSCTEPPATAKGEGEGEGEGESDEGEGEGESGEGEAPLPPAPFAISTKSAVAWKRQRAVESDLLEALALQKGELCNELGLYSCVDFVHTVPLGGNDPFVKSQYEPLASPTVTSPVALERVVLSGCIARVDKDLAGPAVVFTTLQLGASFVDDVEAEATIDLLARRLLRRDVTADERVKLLELTDDGEGNAVSARDFAILGCVVLGTMAETVLY